MSKIVFFCIPAHGHTNPTLGVVRELVRRGHMVWYYSYTPFRDQIESLGATFIACDDYDNERKLTPKDAARIGKDLALSTQVLVDTTLALDDMVCRQMQELKPDCIVADSMAVWGKAVALKYLNVFPPSCHIARTFSRTRSTIDGATDSSSTPMSTNVCVSAVSAPSSPQIPAHFPHLCALSTTILIMRRMALWCGL